MHRLGLRQWPNIGDERPDLAPRTAVERLQDFVARDIAAAEDRLLLQQHFARRNLERLRRTAQYDQTTAAAERSCTGFQRRWDANVVDDGVHSCSAGQVEHRVG